MDKHIMHSDVVKQIKRSNTKRAQEMVDEILEAIKEIKDKYWESKKGDECVIVNIYARKGNDILVCGCESGISATSATKMDYTLAMDDIEQTFYDLQW